jgi:dTDP-4-amino-4,6-dideoxygalactose transaminase
MRQYGATDLEFLAEARQHGKLSGRRDGFVRWFSSAFADHAGGTYGIGRNSNLTALCDALVQFGGVASLSVGATLVFVDVREDNYNLDVEVLEAAITPRTRAAVLTHLLGQALDAPAVVDVCERHGLRLIEDRAHSVGARWNGQNTGTFGDAGVFSFQHNKQLSTGHGGVIVTEHERPHDLRYNEWPSGDSPLFLTLNYHMTEMAGAVGLAQIQHVDDYISAYAAAERTLADSLEDAPWLLPRVVAEGASVTPDWWTARCRGAFFRSRGKERDTVLPHARTVLDSLVHMPVIEMSTEQVELVGAGLRAAGDQIWSERSRGSAYSACGAAPWRRPRLHGTPAWTRSPSTIHAARPQGPSGPPGRRRSSSCWPGLPSSSWQPLPRRRRLCSLKSSRAASTCCANRPW